MYYFNISALNMENIADYIKPVTDRSTQGIQQITTEKPCGITLEYITTAPQSSQPFHGITSENMHPATPLPLSSRQQYHTQDSGIYPFIGYDRNTNSSNVSMTNYIQTPPYSNQRVTVDCRQGIYIGTSDEMPYSTPCNRQQLNYENNYQQNTRSSKTFYQDTTTVNKIAWHDNVQKDYYYASCVPSLPNPDQIQSCSKQLSQDYASYLNASMETRNAVSCSSGDYDQHNTEMDSGPSSHSVIDFGISFKDDLASTDIEKHLVSSAMQGLENFNARLNSGFLERNNTNKSPSHLKDYRRNNVSSPYACNDVNRGRNLIYSDLKVTCEYCCFTARTEAGLKLHQRKCGEFAERKCKHCNQYFRTKYNLRQHLRAKHGLKSLSFKCQLCSESYAQFSELAEHTKFTHMDSYLTHICQICGNKFLSKSRLQEHQTSQHFHLTSMPIHFSSVY